MKKVMAVLAVTALWLAPQGASARGKGFAKLPVQKGKQTKLEIRMMGYKNGKLVAEGTLEELRAFSGEQRLSSIFLKVVHADHPLSVSAS